VQAVPFWKQPPLEQTPPSQESVPQQSEFWAQREPWPKQAPPEQAPFELQVNVPQQSPEEEQRCPDVPHGPTASLVGTSMS
jgi:hypothetical protein